MAPPARHALPIGLLLSVMAALLVLSSLHKRLVYDEFDNLAYGYKVLTEGPSIPRNGQRMPILGLNAISCRAEGCRKVLLDASEAETLRVRVPTMAFALLLALAAYGWACEMFGPPGALLALVLCVFDPTLLAHGKQVTSDVQAAFFTLASVWALWRLGRSSGRSVLNLVFCALATTGALLSKYTSLLLAPILGLLLLLDALRRHRAGERQALRQRGLEALALVLLVLFFLNAAYLFQGTFTRADQYDWRSRGLQFLRPLPLPLPLPRVFVRGLDFSAYVQEQPDVGRGYNYVLGRLGSEGVCYAFPLMLLLKTPLGLFGLLALALWRWPRGSWRDAAFLLLPFSAFLAFFSLSVDPQLGIRYLLPGLAFLTVGAAAVLAPAARGRGVLVGALVAWCVISTLSYHPHYMSYFNELIGRRVNASRYLADSNLDWEDRSYDIARYMARHPEMKIALEPDEPRAGYILVGANRLVGVYEPERYRWLRENFQPVGQVGYSYLLFDVPPDSLSKVLSKPDAR